MGDWFIYGLPIAGALLGLVAFLTALRDSRAFDRKYGRGRDAGDDPLDRRRTTGKPHI